MIIAPSPTKYYLQLIEKLRTEMELVAKRKKTSYRDANLLKNEAALLFRESFQLQPTDASIVFEASALIRSVTKSQWIIDHASYLKFDPSVWVTVTQPYDCADFQARFEKQLEVYGIGLVDCTAWSWYYPGRCFCYALVFTRGSIKLLKWGAKATGWAQRIFGSASK